MNAVKITRVKLGVGLWVNKPTESDEPHGTWGCSELSKCSRGAVDSVVHCIVMKREIWLEGYADLVRGLSLDAIEVSIHFVNCETCISSLSPLPFWGWNPYPPLTMQMLPTEWRHSAWRCPLLPLHFLCFPHSFPSPYHSFFSFILPLLKPGNKYWWSFISGLGVCVRDWVSDPGPNTC